MQRHEFERWARKSKRVILEGSAVRLFDAVNLYLAKEDRSVAPHLRSDGYWESWVSTWFANVLDETSEPTMFIDIGAHLGYYSALATSFGADVMPFEPNPRMVGLLRRSFEPYSVCSILATDDVPHLKEMTIYDEYTGSSTALPVGELVGEFGPHSTVEVEAMRPNAQKRFCDVVDSDEYARYIVKIDTEGAEEDVWNSLGSFLVTCRPILFIEYTPGCYSKTFFKSLQEYGIVREINMHGTESYITEEELNSRKDWTMISVRPYEGVL